MTAEFLFWFLTLWIGVATGVGITLLIQWLVSLPRPHPDTLIPLHEAASILHTVMHTCNHSDILILERMAHRMFPSTEQSVVLEAMAREILTRVPVMGRCPTDTHLKLMDVRRSTSTLTFQNGMASVKYQHHTYTGLAVKRRELETVMATIRHQGDLNQRLPAPSVLTSLPPLQSPRTCPHDFTLTRRVRKTRKRMAPRQRKTRPADNRQTPS